MPEEQFADVSLPGAKDLIAERVKHGINDAALIASPARHSWRVKPSDLAGDCAAKLWYAFRWTKLGEYDGRMARLFKRGSKAEAGLTGYLRSMGWEIRDFEKRLVVHKQSGSYQTLDWDAVVSSEYLDVSQDDAHIKIAQAGDRWLLRQYRVSDFGGHLSGYLDGIGRHPIYSAGAWVQIEFKTYKSKLFSILVQKSLKISNPKYYGQAVLYLRYTELPWCLFVAVNKDDDDIYIEVIERDPGRANDLINIAQTIISSKVRPARVAESAAFIACKVCEFVGVCHHGQLPDKNCRSCQHCEATDGGKFRCNKWNAVIPNEAAILAACPAHWPIR